MMTVTLVIVMNLLGGLKLVIYPWRWDLLIKYSYKNTNLRKDTSSSWSRQFAVDYV
jgi:hypothetical protein